MQVSETWAKVLGGALVAVMLAAALVFVSAYLPPNHVHAQGSGTVGIYTVLIPIFKNQSVTASSAIFPDNGFGCNLLNFQNSSFVGTIDVEWSPTGSAPFYNLTQASYTGLNVDSGYHTLQVGGYFPNMRSTVTPTSGSLSAWYTAQSGPCPMVSSGVGTNGPSAPINCDRNFSSTILATTTGPIGPGTGLPANTGDTVVFCGFTLSFNAAPSNSFVQIVWAATNACSTPTTGWYTWTTAASPQILVVPLAQRSPLPVSLPVPCLFNNTSAAVNISASYASVHGL